ncbi:MAG: hypothetical protein AAF532_01310 [Planctomycetota bacterium]
MSSAIAADAAASAPAIDLAGVHGVVDPASPASADFPLRFKQGWIYFSSAENRATYETDPGEYEHVANFQIVRTGQYVQLACPLSGEPPDEDFGSVTVDGLKVAVLCPECAKGLQNAPLDEQIFSLFEPAAFRDGQFTPLTAAPTVADTIEGLIAAIEAGRYADVFERYAVPAEVEKMRARGDYDRSVQEFGERNGPTLLAALKSIGDREPTFADDGLTAWFPTETSLVGQKKIAFVKIDGEWRLPNSLPRELRD